MQSATFYFGAIFAHSQFARRPIAVCLAVLVIGWCSAVQAGDAERPNVVIVFCDDLGYADVGPFGAEGYATPHIDRLAREGMKLTNFYVAQAVCSASRAALMTGCYSNRVGILGALGPKSTTGINAEETTLGEMLQARGYKTGCFGKWHLGYQPQFLPTNNGFDEYFGLPYSNDMWPKHPENPQAYPPLPLISGAETVELMPDQRNLTTWYAEHAVDFIERHHEGPFFVYLAHSMPHVPLFVSSKFDGRTSRGLFGDVIEEIDWSVGQVLEALERTGAADNTLVIFTSDNGPWLSYGDHAGSAGPLREGKGTAFDGGVREPFVAWFPGRIPAASFSDEPAMTIDILPTVARLTGASVPSDRIIDGRDIWPILSGDVAASSPHEALYFYWGGELQAIRSGDWKLHFPHAYRSLGGRPGGTGGIPTQYEQREIGLSLFNLAEDQGESTNVASRHPEVVKRLVALAEAAREDLGDTATKRQGRNVRPAGRADAAE